MLENIMTWFGAGVMILGIICVVVGHSVDAYRWLRRKINSITEV